MSKVDIVKAREGIDGAEDAFSQSPGQSFDDVKAIARAALDELEALRKPVSVTAYSFDMAAARAELVEIDRAWAAGVRTAAFQGARALLDRALDAIDAGWSAVDVEGACDAAWTAGDNTGHAGTFAVQDGSTRDAWRASIKAAFAHVGRPEPTITTDVPQSSPMGAASRLLVPFAITDEMVRTAAARAWAAGTSDRTPEGFNRVPRDIQETYEDEARAVLEYAASIGGIAPVRPVASSALSESPPDDDIVEKAAIAAWCAEDTIEKWWSTTEYVRDSYRAIGKAVLLFATSLPVSDNVSGDTELCAIAAWCSSEGQTFDTWRALASDATRAKYRREARAMLNAMRPVAPAVDPRAERLVDYRCAFIVRGYSCESAEQAAHTMLAAEKEPTHG